MEFIDNQPEDPDDEDDDPVDMTVGDVHLRGVYEVTETGSGYTERYKSEREQESGGTDEIDEPPAATLEISAWAEEESWQRLNELRESRDPFPVSVGPFVFEEMGITNIEKVVRAEMRNAAQLNISLQEFREVTVQRQNLDEVLGGGSTDGEAGGGGSGPGGLPDDAGEWDGSTSGTPEYSNVRFAGGISESNITDQDDYYLLEVPSGTMGTVLIDDDAVFSNFLIDITASGAGIIVHAANGQGTNATASDISDNYVIRNVGVRGSQPSRPGSQFVPSTTSEALVENIYAGGGEAQYPNTAYDQTGFWINPAHSGVTHIRGVWVEGFSDNGMYFSPPADVGGGGGPNVYVENVYARRNSISCVRIATEDTIDNCCLISNNDNAGNHRGLWSYPNSGNVYVENCDLMGTGGDPQSFIVASGTTAVCTNSRWDSVSGNVNGESQGEPEERIPEGVPTNAIQAASGG